MTNQNPTPKEWAAAYEARKLAQLQKIVDIADAIGVPPNPMMMSEANLDLNTEKGRTQWAEASEKRAKDRGCTCGPGMLQINHFMDGEVVACLFDHDDPECPLHAETKSPYHPENLDK